MKFSTSAAVLLGALVVAATPIQERSAFVARRPVVRSFSTDADPVSQIRLAYNGQDGMTVSWNSPQQLSNPTVYFSEHPDQVLKDQVAVGPASSIYPTSDTWDNHVVISGLKPFTKYFYTVTDANLSDQEIQDSYFTTARAAGDEGAFAVVAFGDLGIIDENGNLPFTFQSLVSQAPTYDFVWHSGDFGYADQWNEEMQDGLFPQGDGVTAYTSIMASYYNELAAVTKNRPYMVGVGNHEAQCDEGNLSLCPVGQTNFTAYLNHFNMPTAQQTDGFVQNLWYSFESGMAHFIQINTETDYPTAEDEGNYQDVFAGPFGAAGQQLAWLEADLQGVDRTKTPWVVVAAHRAWFSANTICDQCRTAFDALMVKYAVDVVWFGHVHYYERDVPLINGEIDPAGLNDPRGPLYLTAGGAGNVEGHSVPNDPLPNYVAVVNGNDYGYLRFTFNSRTELDIDYFASQSNSIIDHATLHKSHNFGC